MWLICLISAVLSAVVPIRKVSVWNDPNTGIWQVTEGVLNETALAWGTFEDGLEITGWGILTLETNPTADDHMQSAAAGFLEGYLTVKRIEDHAANVMDIFFKGGPVPAEIQEFFNSQYEFTMSMASKNPDDPQWHHVGVIAHQYDGLIDGYNFAAQQAGTKMLDNMTFAILNGVGDLFQIQPAVMPSERISWFDLEQREAELLFHKRTHCSALIKVLPGLEDLMFGHSSWFEFSHTNRIYKTYTLNLKHNSTATKKMSFSSYPGFLESLDDFYMMDSGLGMTQTSNEVFDDSLLDLITPNSLLAWQRVRLANVMSKSGPEWKENFGFHPSGTYVNQYMIIDMNLFTPGQPLKDNTLYVLEEMPGYIEGADVTNQLERGYWSSYNVPYFKDVWTRSGYGKMAEKMGTPFWTYDLAPRASVFRREAGTVANFEDFKNVLRFNDYKNDPYSFDGKTQNPMWSICSRGDLDTISPSYGGCYDTKVTSHSYGFFDQKAQILNGPTQSHSLPAFSWKSLDSIMHQGLPETYNFTFIDVPSVAI